MTEVDADELAESGIRQVVIIEDETELAELFAVWTRKHFGDQAEVHQAHSVGQGEDLLQRLHRVDVVILDRHFPSGSGDQLLQRIAAEFDAIAVVITGLSPEPDIIRLPLTDYLVKPIDEETFAKRLSLLEKLKTAGVLTAYTNARKASLLEYHLDDPAAHPLFRRFAARWSYDRLEAIDTGSAVLLYELYLAHDDDPAGDISVSIVGSLAGELEELIALGDIKAVGEIVPTGDEYAWIDVQRSGPVEPATDGFVIYEFAVDDPERHVSPETPSEPAELRRLETCLAETFSS